jgi:uncharacterized membrane protein YphA (DoxX/SURF4 family)
MSSSTSSPVFSPSAPQSAPRSFTRFLPIAARLLLGLVFFVLGLNGFLNFIPPPPTMPEKVTAFLGALMATGYMLPLISGTELLAGFLLLLGRFVPLALLFLAPVIVNIVAFHLFLDRSGMVIALIVTALQLYLAWAYRAAFRPVLAARTTIS